MNTKTKQDAKKDQRPPATSEQRPKKPVQNWDRWEELHCELNNQEQERLESRLTR